MNLSNKLLKVLLNLSTTPTSVFIFVSYNLIELSENSFFNLLLTNSEPLSDSIKVGL